MLRILTLLFVLVFSHTFIIAQDLNWKKHKKTAEQAFVVGKYAEAAKHFEQAWEKHPQSDELIYQAGECYALLKDFKNASRTYRQVKEKNEAFPLVGLKYARALKQDGQYEAAKRELVYFSNVYQEEDKALINQIVATEIKGCDLGMRLAKNSGNSTVEVTHLNEQINSLKTEIAPIPFAEELLYFSSTRKDNKAYLYRSQKQRGNWSKAVAAENLPDLENKHLANGTFTPDSKRFYFTLCDATSEGSGLVSICEIFVLKRTKAGWSEPIRMRDYINEAGSTTTHPHVIHKDGQEILYFASNRKGGKGGMDIWYSTREIDSGDIDFTYPVNLGKQVNTIGDEMTPFYDDQAGVLFFSSNGHVTLGGWDIFKTTGSEKKWELPENMGLPINSSADDFYYTLKPSRKSGFLVSNRTAGPEKVSTLHEDIFEFGAVKQQQKRYVSGQVMEKGSTADLQNVTVYLYELIGQSERLLQTKKTNSNQFKFPILPNKKYRLVVSKEKYLKNSFDFNTLQKEQAISHDFYLSKTPTTPPTTIQNTPSNKRAATTAPTTSKPTPVYQQPPTVVQTTTTVSTPRINTSPVRPKTNNRNTTTSNSTTSLQGTYYKVQLIAVDYYNSQHARYRDVKNLGNMETEQVPNQQVMRVLLANYLTKQEARTIKAQAQTYGFADAFMVKYRDGRRIGMVYE